MIGIDNDNDNCYNDNDILKTYGSRYEHLLTQNRKLHCSGGNRNNIEKAVSLLSNHAAMEGMLLTTLKAAKLSNGTTRTGTRTRTRTTNINGDSIEGIQCLLEETLHCNDYGLDAAGANINSSLGNILTLAAVDIGSEQSELEQAQGQGQEGQGNGRGSSRGKPIGTELMFDIQPELDLDSDNEVDDFFDKYPECVHNNWNYFEEIIYENQNQNENQNQKPEPEHKSSKPTSSKPEVPVVDLTVNAPVKKPVHNPYASSNLRKKGSMNSNGNGNGNTNGHGHGHGNTNGNLNGMPNNHNPYNSNHNHNHNHNNNNNNNNNDQSWDAYSARNEDPTRQHLVVSNNMQGQGRGRGHGHGHGHGQGRHRGSGSNHQNQGNHDVTPNTNTNANANANANAKNAFRTQGNSSTREIIEMPMPMAVAMAMMMVMVTTIRIKTSDLIMIMIGIIMIIKITIAAAMRM